MAGRDILEAFNDCVDRLARGEGIEDCLGAYPQFADELAPMLETGLLVRRAEVTSDEMQLSQERVRFRLEREMARAPLVQPRSGGWRSIAGWVVAFLLVMVLISGGTAVVAQESLPGDVLYGYKRLIEEVRLRLSPLPFTPDEDTLTETFAEERREEVRQVLALGREVDVAFDGVVDVVGDVSLVVSGLRLRTDAEVLDFVAGERVTVRARSTQDGELIATSITRGDGNPQNIVPTPTITPVEPTRVTPSETLPTQTPQRDGGTPTQTIAPTACVVAAPAGWEGYTIQSGDTLSSLAARTGTTIERIMVVNCLDNANVLTVGWVIFLPVRVDSPPVVTSATPVRREGDQPPPTGENANPPPAREPTPTRQNNGGGRAN